MGGVQQSGVSPATSLRGWMAAAASALCWRVQHQLARRVGAGWRPAGLQSYNTPDVRAREGADYSSVDILSASESRATSWGCRNGGLVLVRPTIIPVGRRSLGHRPAPQGTADQVGIYSEPFT